MLGNMDDGDTPTDWTNYIAEFRITPDISPTACSSLFRDRERLFTKESTRTSLEAWAFRKGADSVEKTHISTGDAFNRYLDVRSNKVIYTKRFANKLVT